jgi:hypothetical protein
MFSPHDAMEYITCAIVGRGASQTSSREPASKTLNRRTGDTPIPSPMRGLNGFPIAALNARMSSGLRRVGHHWLVQPVTVGLRAAHWASAIVTEREIS